jgi:hypothetical protein
MTMRFDEVVCCIQQSTVDPVMPSHTLQREFKGLSQLFQFAMQMFYTLSTSVNVVRIAVRMLSPFMSRRCGE